MKRDSSAKINNRKIRRKLVYVRTMGEIPDFKSDDEIAAWYQTHSTVLIQDKLETFPAKVSGNLHKRLKTRRGKDGRATRGSRHSRTAQ